MALIERTIYPKLSNKIPKKELIQEYTPSSDELNVVYSSFKNGNKVFTFIVLLKVFKKLRYFPKVTDIPTEIIEYIKSKLNLMDTVSIENSRNVIYEYQRKIREQLSIISDKKCIKNIVVKTVQEYEPIMEHPADIFNAVIETLIKNNCELPAFSTLERLINNKRTEINQKIYDDVNSKLTESEKNFLDLLLQSNEKGVSPFNYIKELPKSPTLKHMKEIKENYLYLKSLNYGENIVKTIHPAKVKYFSAQGNALDASEMKDFNEAKRYTILICFIYNCTIKTCDDLITMFIKRIGKIHTRAKEKLQLILEKQRDKTETIVEAFQGFLISSYNCNDSNTIADNFKKMIQNNGGYESLLKDCEEITAYNNNNYYPLLWSSFKNHRKTLFKIIKMISISSTTQDHLLIEAINYLLDNEHKKSDYIDALVDISFSNQKWQKIVKCKHKGKEVFSRRYFEMCVFSYISSEFKTGDISVEGSEEYADYRKQLLSWEECEPLIKDYCLEMNLPTNKKDFMGYGNHSCKIGPLYKFCKVALFYIFIFSYNLPILIK